MGFEPTDPCGSTDFECCTFDHSDNSPCLFSSGFLSRNLLKNSLERKQERRQKIFDFEIFCVEEYQGESGGRNSQLLPKFRGVILKQVSSRISTKILIKCRRNAEFSRLFIFFFIEPYFAAYCAFVRIDNIFATRLFLITSERYPKEQTDITCNCHSNPKKIDRTVYDQNICKPRQSPWRENGYLS